MSSMCYSVYWLRSSNNRIPRNQHLDQHRRRHHHRHKLPPLKISYVLPYPRSNNTPHRHPHMHLHVHRHRCNRTAMGMEMGPRVRQIWDCSPWSSPSLGGRSRTTENGDTRWLRRVTTSGYHVGLPRWGDLTAEHLVVYGPKYQSHSHWASLLPKMIRVLRPFSATMPWTSESFAQFLDSICRFHQRTILEVWS